MLINYLDVATPSLLNRSYLIVNKNPGLICSVTSLIISIIIACLYNKLR